MTTAGGPAVRDASLVDRFLYVAATAVQVQSIGWQPWISSVTSIGQGLGLEA
jgi:hypothetical protein